MDIIARSCYYITSFITTNNAAVIYTKKYFEMIKKMQNCKLSGQKNYIWVYTHKYVRET